MQEQQKHDIQYSENNELHASSFVQVPKSVASILEMKKISRILSRFSPKFQVSEIQIQSKKLHRISIDEY